MSLIPLTYFTMLANLYKAKRQCIMMPNEQVVTRLLSKPATEEWDI